MILRDRDANTNWEAAADSVLEERVYYCQNWRADVVALFTEAGQLINQLRYDPYGVPFSISKADVNADGSVNTSDITRFGSIWNGGSGTHPLADWNFDGAVNTADYTAYLNDNAADTGLGRGNVSYPHAHFGGDSRKAYAGYEIDPVLADADTTTGKHWLGFYHVRHRVYISHLGRWTRRDPLGYVDGMNVYMMVSSSPLVSRDWSGLYYARGGGCSTCGPDDNPTPPDGQPPLGDPPPDWPRIPGAPYWFERCYDDAFNDLNNMLPIKISPKCMKQYRNKISDICSDQAMPEEFRPSYYETQRRLLEAFEELINCDMPKVPKRPVRKPKPVSPPLRNINMPNLKGKDCFDACGAAKTIGSTFCSTYALSPMLHDACNAAVNAGYYDCLKCCGVSMDQNNVAPCVQTYLKYIENAVNPVSTSPPESQSSTVVVR